LKKYYLLWLSLKIGFVLYIVEFIKIKMLITIHKNNQIKRIEAFADTHGWHREYHYDSAATDILVCAGDVCEWGDEKQLRDFFAWFAEQPTRFKLFVAGNHDLPFCFEPKYAERFYIPEGVTYIENGGVTLDGIDFYVLPARWGLQEQLPLPKGVDVLVTHCAPLNILDDNGRWGCPILHDLVCKAEPKIHIFGHAHENGQQTTTFGETDFYNVAVDILDDGTELPTHIIVHPENPVYASENGKLTVKSEKVKILDDVHKEQTLSRDNSKDFFIKTFLAIHGS